MSFPKKLNLENYFPSPVWWADESKFVNKLNKASDKYIKDAQKRLKKDIEDYTYDIDKFKAFRTRTFEWINKEEHGNKTNCVGFVAQEVESTDTRWVDENQINDTSGDGTTNADWDLIPENEKGIRKSKTSKLGEKDAMYVSVIQQLITRIEALENA